MAQRFCRNERWRKIARRSDKNFCLFFHVDLIGKLSLIRYERKESWCKEGVGGSWWNCKLTWMDEWKVKFFQIRYKGVEFQWCFFIAQLDLKQKIKHFKKTMKKRIEMFFFMRFQIIVKLENFGAARYIVKKIIQRKHSSWIF